MEWTVGIFSRSTEYAWLTDILERHCETLPVYISNDNRYTVIQQLSRCHIAILYHSKNRGRINITDVTDSLYDEEVFLLSDKLGKDRVLVVIDDLDDSSEEVKNRIANSQPTLRDRTRCILLFTKQEKGNKQILNKKVQPIIDLLQREEEQPTTAENTTSGTGGRDERSQRISDRSIGIVACTVLALVVFQDTYISPNHRNMGLTGLWTAGLLRAWSRMPSQYLWFNNCIHSVVLWTVTAAIFYNAYRRPSPTNVFLPVFWFISSLRRTPRHPLNLKKKYVLKAMGRGLMLFSSFWIGWQIRNTSDLPMLIVKTILCSPAILTSL